MTSDRYVKAVLTVIAACLVYICVAVTTGPPVAAQSPTEVVIVGWQGRISGVTTGQIENHLHYLPSRGGGAQPLPVGQ